MLFDHPQDEGCALTLRECIDGIPEAIGKTLRGDGLLGRVGSLACRESVPGPQPTPPSIASTVRPNDVDGDPPQPRIDRQPGVVALLARERDHEHLLHQVLARKATAAQSPNGSGDARAVFGERRPHRAPVTGLHPMDEFRPAPVLGYGNRHASCCRTLPKFPCAGAIKRNYLGEPRSAVGALNRLPEGTLRLGGGRRRPAARSTRRGTCTAPRLHARL